MRDKVKNKPTIVLVEPNTIIRERIKSLFINKDIEILEASNRKEFTRVMSQVNYNVDLVIAETEIDPRNSFDGIGLINLVKSKRSGVPVMMLTSVCRKDVITQYLRAGAADYVLKPFKDEYLEERVLKYTDIENLTEATVLQFNLKEYIESEIYKANKGKYSFSLVTVKFDSKIIVEKETAENSFYTHAEKLFNEMKSLFWKSDIYIQHGYQSHLGIFPFCDDNYTNLIIKKIKSAFLDFKQNQPFFENYKIFCEAATYPIDGGTTSELLSKLASVEKE